MDQYHAVLLALDPLQRLWKFAASEGRLRDFKSVSSLLRLLFDFPEDCVTRALFHGPGGSGKTFCMMTVVIPVYKRYCPRGYRAAASQNSAARLIAGSTFHVMSALQTKSSLHTGKSSDAQMKKLVTIWSFLIFFLVDEVSLADPQLLAKMNAQAGWGRRKACNLDPSDFVKQPFGKVLLQLLLGDFMQLNPVLSHTLIEAFLQNTDLVVPRVPTYEKDTPEVRAGKQKLDKEGYQIFDIMTQNVVLFRGSYRFKTGDPLAELLTIMRTPGGAPVPLELRWKIEARMTHGSNFEQRIKGDYVLRDADGHQVGPKGFFAQGFYSAINWEQVSRLQQLWASHTAVISTGPEAYQNTRSGKPQKICWHFPPAAAKVSSIRAAVDAPNISLLLKECLQQSGQLLFYVQAVDVCDHRKEFKEKKDVYLQALAVATVSYTHLTLPTKRIV